MNSPAVVTAGERIGRLINHDRVEIRLLSLGTFVGLIFSIAWILSYHFLPQGLLRGPNPVATAPYAGTVAEEFLRLFGWNVGVSLLAIAANTFRSVNTPLGYLFVVVQAPRYGAIWGTGSLGVGTGARIEPALRVLVERSGPMEILGIVAIVVATRAVMIWHQQSTPRRTVPFERVRSPREWEVSGREVAVLVGGYLLLAIANYREAVAIAQTAV
jgi:hypothetical protein